MSCHGLWWGMVRLTENQVCGLQGELRIRVHECGVLVVVSHPTKSSSFVFLLHFSFPLLPTAWLFSLLIRPFCVFLTVLSSTSLLPVQPPFPCAPCCDMSTTDQEDNQLENNMTAGGDYSLPSDVTQICVSHQTKPSFSLEAKIDWYMGKSATIDFFFSLQSAFFFPLILLLCIWLLAAVFSVPGECTWTLFN